MRDTNTTSTLRGKRLGFTLIEMLVSAALVVLIMSLFAQIFALATKSIEDQRTIGRFDQKVRVLERTLRQDLEAMTYRQLGDAEGDSRGIVPLHPDYPVDEDRQRGYFYYSENDPNLQVDDVLQMTVDLVSNRRAGTSIDESAPTKFVGSAQQLAGVSVVDQPTADDGLAGVGRVASRAAEVSYFLRNGNLYRRTLLLRDPPSDPTRRGQPSLGFDGSVGPLLGEDRQLASMPGAIRFPGDYDGALDTTLVHADFNGDGSVDAGETQSDYFNDFDLSATRYEYLTGTDTGFETTAIFVHTTESLSNLAAERPLGRPWNRFGHFPLSPNDVVVPSGGDPFVPGAGQPFEFLRDTDGRPVLGQYIGRFTHGETSFSQFNWPGSRTAGASPFNRTDLTLTSDRVVSSGTNSFLGPRFAEDLVIGNVVAFDVKLWDDFAQQFVDLGGGATGIYGAGSGAFSKIRERTFDGGGVLRGTFAYGPRVEDSLAALVASDRNNVFDTWHPSVDGMTSLDSNADGTLQLAERNVFDGTLDPPPVWPAQSTVNVPADNNGGNGVSGDGQIAVGNRNNVADFEGVWDTNQAYQFGDTVRPDLNTRPYSLAATDPSLGDMLFRCVQATDVDGDTFITTDTFAAGGTQPDWMQAIKYGQVRDINSVGDIMVWRPVYTENRIGLKKLAIVIKIRDPKTNSVRDLTIVHSFVE